MKKIKTFLITLLMIFCLAGCQKKEEVDYSNMIKVNFVLNGGTFKNSNYNVVQYYPYKDGGTLIAALNMDSSGGKASLEYSGKVFKGWYLDNEFTTLFDFTNDKVSNETTLYAKWTEPHLYTYGVYEKGSEDNPVAVLDNNGNPISIDVDEGETLYKKSIEKVLTSKSYKVNEEVKYGHTIIGYYDETGNTWDDSFTHPGGENDLEVKVFIEYIEGIYSIVTNKTEFKASLTKNIYLKNDIDLEGETISFTKQEKNIIGNNHIISNFVVKVDAGKTGIKANYEDEIKDSVYISLLGETKNSNISDVSFENVTWTLTSTYSNLKRVYFNPLCSLLENSNISNVKITGTLNITQTPTLDELNIDATNYYIYRNINDNSVLNNITYEINQNDTRK